MKRMPQISDVIAVDDWHFKRKDGKTTRSRVIVGRPRPENKNKTTTDWVCSVFIEGVTPKVCKAMGVGPVDSLMNAMTLVKSHFDAIQGQLVDIGIKKKRHRT
jgi:hypothetical protein